MSAPSFASLICESVTLFALPRHSSSVRSGSSFALRFFSSSTGANNSNEGNNVGCANPRAGGSGGSTLVVVNETCTSNRPCFVDRAISKRSLKAFVAVKQA